jgi:hypothetical protein
LIVRFSEESKLPPYMLTLVLWVCRKDQSPLERAL